MIKDLFILALILLLVFTVKCMYQKEVELWNTFSKCSEIMEYLEQYDIEYQ